MGCELLQHPLTDRRRSDILPGVFRTGGIACVFPQWSRRELFRLVGSAAAAWPCAVRAQQSARLPRVGYLFSFRPVRGPTSLGRVRTGVARPRICRRARAHCAGARSGQRLARAAPGAGERAGAVRGRRDRRGGAPAARAAKAATATIPIVIVAVGEPMKAGLIASFAHPGGNVTGLSLLTRSSAASVWSSSGTSCRMQPAWPHS